MIKNLLIFGFIVFILNSCSMFSHRFDSFNVEDATYFQPNKDFPVTAGDGEHQAVWDRRTLGAGNYSSSSDSIEKMTEEQSIERELKRLESLQPQSLYEQYMQYYHQFSSDSQRIYFLRLSSMDSRDLYLVSRGYKKDQSQLKTSGQFAANRKQLIEGMNKFKVVETYGKPSYVEYYGEPEDGIERWVYEGSGSEQSVYFKSGTVRGWE